MKKTGIIVSGVMALMFAATPMYADIVTNGPKGWGPGVSGADPQFDFIVNIGPDTGFGSVNATDEGGGMFLATSGTFNVTGGLDIGTYSLFPGGPAGTYSPSGQFIFDNLFSPASDPTVDNDGLLFTGGGLEVNIFSNGPDSYSFYSWDGSGYNVADDGPGPVAFTVIPTPEPSALVLLGSLLVGLGLSRRRKA